jgi:hypothetical protein
MLPESDKIKRLWLSGCQVIKGLFSISTTALAIAEIQRFAFGCSGLIFAIASDAISAKVSSAFHRVWSPFPQIPV